MNGSCEKTDGDRGEDGVTQLHPCTGDYLPEAHSIAEYRLTTTDARLQALRDVAEYCAGRRDPLLVVVPGALLGTLVEESDLSAPIVWAVWVPDDWANEVPYLIRAILDVANLPATKYRQAATCVSVWGRDCGVWCNTKQPPTVRAWGTPANLLVVAWVCQGIAHVVRYAAVSADVITAESADVERAFDGAESARGSGIASADNQQSSGFVSLFVAQVFRAWRHFFGLH